MNEWDGFFLVLAGIVAWRARGDRTALKWLLAAAASYAISAAWRRLDGPSPYVMAAACDALVCFAVYAVGKLEWEMRLWRIFQFALFVNIVNVGYAAGLLPIVEEPVWALLQSGLLDLCNLAVLAWIWINGARQPAGGADGLSPFHRALRGLHRVAESLHRERTHLPFWKARHKWTN